MKQAFLALYMFTRPHLEKHLASHGVQTSRRRPDQTFLYFHLISFLDPDPDPVGNKCLISTYSYTRLAAPFAVTENRTKRSLKQACSEIELNS